METAILLLVGGLIGVAAGFAANHLFARHQRKSLYEK